MDPVMMNNWVSYTTSEPYDMSFSMDPTINNYPVFSYNNQYSQLTSYPMNSQFQLTSSPYPTSGWTSAAPLAPIPSSYSSAPGADNVSSDKPIMFRAEFRERSDNWSAEETQLMLDILHRDKDKFQRLRKNQAVWANLVSELSRHQINRTKSNCKNRWKVLVTKYNRAIKERSKCEFYDDIHHLLKSKLKADLPRPVLSSPSSC